MSAIRGLRFLDAYPKTLEDFRTKTVSGAVISIVSIVFMTTLFVSELSSYMTVDHVDHLYVDVTRNEKMKVYLDVTFPHLPCNVISLDTMDVSGEQQQNVYQNIYKRRLDSNGKAVGTAVKDGPDTVTSPEKQGEKEEKKEELCMTCYGASDDPNACCNTCESVRVAYQRKGWGLDPTKIEQCKKEGVKNLFGDQLGEGCQLYGQLTVSKVAGNFHIAPGRSFQMGNLQVHDFMAYRSGAQMFNVTHTVNYLRFGDKVPGVSNPLDGRTRVVKDASAMHQYFLKVVPTVYEPIRGQPVQTNQFSATEHYRRTDTSGHALPGVFFFYDLSPIMVKVEERSRAFTHFLTSMCAILGGVFTVSGMLDKVVYHSVQTLSRRRSSAHMGDLTPQ